MLKCKEIINFMEKIAPTNLAESWDNVGLIIGSYENNIKTILICLDVTEKVIDEAIEKNVDLIIAHHPFIFNKIKSITDNNFLGRKIIKCIKNNISVYSSHTNLDIVKDGTNDTLFDLLKLENKQGLLQVDENNYLGRVGNFKNETTLEQLVLLIKEKLNLDNIKYSGEKNTILKNIGICTGSGSNYDFFNEALEKNCNVYITGDVKHHEALDALEMGLCLIDGTHYKTEALIIDVLKEKLKNFVLDKNINIIKTNIITEPLNNI